uniref:Secreted protein n=1 Tax=Rhipicephalus zambeziensis TaxID=60191 RepID=A0A224YGL0_9ACAR
MCQTMTFLKIKYLLHVLFLPLCHVSRGSFELFCVEEIQKFRCVLVGSSLFLEALSLTKLKTEKKKNKWSCLWFKPPPKQILQFFKECLPLL